MQALLGHFDELAFAIAIDEGSGLERLHGGVDQRHVRNS